jgi:hypothetical protein
MSQWKVNHSLINFASNQIVDALFLIVFFVVAYQYHAYTLITNAIITYAWNWKETRGSQEPVIAHLAFNLTSKVDRKWGSGAALVPNMLAPENLDAITCSYKIVLCQACKFYHSWRQLWSHDTVVLLLVTCQKGKLLFIMIFSVILDVLFTLGPFSCWKWNRNFVWEQQPEVYLQSVNKEWFRTSVTDCDLSWLTRKYFDSRWYLLFHGLLSACYRYEDLIYL